MGLTARNRQLRGSRPVLNLLATYSRFAQDHGVTGTPTVLVSYDGPVGRRCQPGVDSPWR